MSEAVPYIPHPLLLLFVRMRIFKQTPEAPTCLTHANTTQTESHFSVQMGEAGVKTVILEARRPKDQHKTCTYPGFLLNTMALTIPPASPLLICMQTHLLFQLSSSLQQTHGACKQEGSYVFDRNHPYN